MQSRNARPGRWTVILAHADLVRFPASLCALRLAGLVPSLVFPALGFVEGAATPDVAAALRSLPDVARVEPAKA